MSRYLIRAAKDILQHRFLNTVTIITIALSIIIVSAFGLFFGNVSDILETWKKGIRIMAYLKPGLHEAELLDAEMRIREMPGVQEITFIPKKEALALLRQQMRRQASLLDDLKENPLPDSFEIRMAPPAQNSEGIERIAERIESLRAVAEVEYGQKWVGRLTNVLDLFRFVGIGLGVLFFMATVFIVGNTIRLMLFSRKEEIEIMRLVGAADRFIKAPFYVQGLVQGFLGGLIGLSVLFAAFSLFAANMKAGFASSAVSVHFFSPLVVFGILLCSMFVGWLGCFLSLRHFFKSL